MTLKPVPLHRHPRVLEAKRACLEVLKDVERRVRAGEIESIAVVMIARDGRAIHQRTEVSRVDTMLGGITRLEHELINASPEVDA
jgi:hypothetical protein